MLKVLVVVVGLFTPGDRLESTSNWEKPTVRRSITLILFTARKRSLGQGNIFTSMCQEFCTQGVSTWAGTPQTRYTPRTRYTHRDQLQPPDQVHPPGTRYTHPTSSACREIRATSGLYASYWNAFLFLY